MGQYFHIASDTAKEYLNDHRISDAIKGFHGIKWGEITFNTFGSLQLLSILITTDTAFGERENPSFTGRWLGHQIGMYGDYTSEGHWDKICEEYTDITPMLMEELLKMDWWREFLTKSPD